MKIKNILLAFTMFFSLQAFTATVPHSWISDSADIFIEKSDEMAELEKSYDNILETKSDMVEDIIKGKPDPKRRWFLQSIATQLTIEKKGTIGVLGMKGETSVALIWQRTPDSIKKLQQKYYGTSSAVAEKSLEDETASSEAVKITSETTKTEMENQLEPIVEAAFVAGKVKKKSVLREKLLSKLSEYQDLLKDLDHTPNFTPWWVYKFQFDLNITAEGAVHPVVNVGTEVRVRVEWYRISRNVTLDKADKEPSENAKFLMAMASDFSAMDELALGANNQKRFALDTIKVGVGLQAKGKIVVASVKGKVFGSIFFKREQVANKSLEFMPALSDTFPVMGEASTENLKYAKDNNITVDSIDKSFGDDVRERIFNASRDKFRKGLKKAVKMAKFWSKGALRREERRMSQGKEVHFNLNVIEIELELYLGGGIGAATVEGIAELELFMVRK